MQKHERSNVTAVKALWISTVSLFHLSRKDRDRRRKYQRGHFPRWEVLKGKFAVQRPREKSDLTDTYLLLIRSVLPDTVLYSLRSTPGTGKDTAKETRLPPSV